MSMTELAEFKHDVFLSHSSKNKDVLRGMAERLNSDGVWVDDTSAETRCVC